MRPQDKGWLKQFLHHFHATSVNENGNHFFARDDEITDTDQKLYRLIQPTGLMYGYPIMLPERFQFRTKYWSEHDKMKVLLADSFINQALLIKVDQIRDQQDIGEIIHFAINELVDFYNNSMNRIPVSYNAFSRKRVSIYDQSEFIIEKRLSVKSAWHRNFWAGFFHNSLLFLDVYFFGLWIKKKAGLLEIEEFVSHQENVRLEILKVISAAAHANATIEHEEKTLFKFFLYSARLNNSLEKKAEEFIHSGIGMDDINVSARFSWILRKYLLEIAILTIWADKIVDESEKTFIKKLAVHLDFSEDELDGSMLAIESFVISNWEQVHFLQSKHNFLLVKEKMANRVGKIIVKNKNAVIQEIHESKELMDLLMKMRKETLTAEEKMKIRAQLIDILKTIPTFVIIALPFTFITLPLLIKLLPRSAFPSAFSEQD